MTKAQSLLEHLLKSPLKLKADEIQISIIDGTTRSVDGPLDHFSLSYTVDLLLLNFSGNAYVLSLVILQWLKKAQPYRKEEAFTFDSDVLNKHKADVVLRIPLEEIIKVEHRPDGVALHSIDDPQNETLLTSAEWALFVNDELFATWHA